MPQPTPASFLAAVPTPLSPTSPENTLQFNIEVEHVPEDGGTFLAEPSGPAADLIPSTPTPQSQYRRASNSAQHSSPGAQLLPPSGSSIDPESSSSSSVPKPAFLSTSLQAQEDLSLQLAQMATQLKLNAMHFSDSLAKDKNLVEDAHNKLEGNFDKMKTERVRLRDHRGKSGYTTWMIMGIVKAVILAWVMMFFLIKLT